MFDRTLKFQAPYKKASRHCSLFGLDSVSIALEHKGVTEYLWIYKNNCNS